MEANHSLAFAQHFTDLNEIMVGCLLFPFPIPSLPAEEIQFECQ